MAITAQMVKELREMTGAGMMDCKKALTAADGDVQKAVDWLREKGMAKAAKKADRATAEGWIASRASADGKDMALASLYCETDFVSRGEAFREMVDKIAATVLDKAPVDVSALEALVGDDVKQLIATVGENMRLGRFFRHSRKSDREVVGQYIHANGKIGVLVWLACGKASSCQDQRVKDLARNLAMQVAATDPQALDASGLAPEKLEREREVYRQKARAEGKPENIIDKIAEGAVKKYAKEVCLLDQPYIREEKKSIAEVVAGVAKEVGDTLKVEGFQRITLTAG